MTTRRDFIAAAPAVALAAAVPAAVATATPTPHPDAELLALGDALRSSWATEQSLPGDDEERLDAAYEKSGAIVSEIEALTAHTLEGIKVKALAILWCHCGEEFTEESFSFTRHATTDERLVSSLLNDIMAMA